MNKITKTLLTIAALLTLSLSLHAEEITSPSIDNNLQYEVIITQDVTTTDTVIVSRNQIFGVDSIGKIVWSMYHYRKLSEVAIDVVNFNEEVIYDLVITMYISEAPIDVTDLLPQL